MILTKPEQIREILKKNLATQILDDLARTGSSCVRLGFGTRAQVLAELEVEFKEAGYLVRNSADDIIFGF